MDELLKSLLRRTADLMFFLDSNGVILSASDASRGIAGYSITQLNGRSIFELTHPEEREKLENKFSMVIESNKDISIDFKLQRVDNSYLPIHADIAPVPETDGIKAILMVNRIFDRQRIEEESRLTKSSVDQSNVAIYWIDKNARFEYVNNKACEMLGYSREELLSMHVFDIDPDFPAERWPEHWEELKESGFLIIESHHRKKDGTVFPVEISANYLVFDGKELNCSFARDITERHKEQQRLRVIQFSIDNTADEVYWLDEDGNIKYVNDTACKVLSYSREELLKKKVHDIDLYVDSEKWKRFWAKIKNRKSVMLESVHRKKNGKEYPVEISSNYITFDDEELICGFARDITDRKNAEEALRKSEETLKSALKAAPIGMAIAKNRIIGWSNDRMSDMLGYSYEELLGMKARMLYPDVETYDRVGRDLYDDADKYGLGSLEAKMVRKDGRIIDVFMSASYVGSGDMRGGLVFAVDDITSRKEAEKQLVESEERYRSLFENSPTPLLELDFSLLKRYIEESRWEKSVDIESAILDSPENLLELSGLAKIKNVNYTFQSMLEIPPGTTPEFLEIIKLLDSESVRKYADTLIRLIKGAKSHEDDFVLDVNGGKRIYIRSNLLIPPGYEDSWSKVLVSAVDLTPRIQAEKELLEISQHNRALLEGIPDKMFVFSKDGTFLDCNVHDPDELLMQPDEFIGKNIMETGFPRDIAELSVKKTKLALETGQPQVFEFMLGDKRDPKYFESRVVKLSDNEALIIERDITDQKRAEEALIKSEELLEQAIEGTGGGIWNLEFEDREDDYYIPDKIYFSHKIKNFMGFDDDEFPNSLRAYNERVHPEDRIKLKKASRDHFEGKTEINKTYYRIKHKNGQWRWIHSRGRIHRDKAGNPIRWIGIEWDVTDSREYQEKIKENEARFRALFEDSPIMLAEENYREVMIYVRELQKSGIKDIGKYLLENDAELVKCESMIKLVNVNKAFLRVYNAKNMAELKKHFTRIPTRNFAEALANTISKLAEGVKSTETELASRTVQGDEIYTYIKVSVAPGYEESFSKVFVSLLDITDRKKSEQKLRASQEMFRALTENSPDIIIRFGKDLRPLYVNPAIEKYTGFKPEEIVGTTSTELGFSKEFSSRLERRLVQVFETGEAYAGEYEIETAKGKFIFDWRVIPEFSSEGKVKTVISTNRDITEMKRLQEFTQRAMRLETAGRIAGQVAHDFNNLLGPLMAYPDLIKDEFAPDHPMLSLLDDMKKATEQIADINQQLLTLGRRGHYKQEVLDINDIVNQAVNRIFPMPQTLIIDLELSPNVMNIKGGPAQILRAVSNLIANARDAMQDVGHLLIATENAYIDEIAGRFGRVPRGEYVKLTIADTGTGIDPEALPKIFDPFFTTKSSSRKKGSGLGLSVVHAVMEDHGGYIDFDSVPGEGTSIFLYFPITRESKTAGISDQISGGSEKILIVDDDRVQREVCQKLLEKLGYQTKLAESGVVALEMLRKEQFDLLLLDMVMPGGLDGSETYEKALEINPGQKAIIISGFAESDRVNKALDMGAGDFIRKPLTLKSIASAVRAELDKKKVRR